MLQMECPTIARVVFLHSGMHQIGVLRSGDGFFIPEKDIRFLFIYTGIFALAPKQSVSWFWAERIEPIWRRSWKMDIVKMEVRHESVVAVGDLE